MKKNKLKYYTDEELYKFLLINENGKLIGVSEESPKFLKKAYKKYIKRISKG